MLFVCLFALLALVRPISAQERPAEGPAQYFLTPAARTAIRLHTHTADIDLAYDGAALVAAVDALYRLQNNASEPAAVTLKLVSDPANAPPPPDNLVVLVNGAPLVVTLADDGSAVVPVQVAADSTLDVRLNYAVTLGDGPLAILSYPTAALAAWPGQPSLRVSIGALDAAPETSWLRIAPDGWNYAPGASAEPRNRWLYDAQLPDERFLFTFIHPASWQQLTQAAAEAPPGAPTATYLRQAELLRKLVTAAGDQGLRERFFAQAVAAYAAGLENTTAIGAPPAESAPLHAGLAALYRTRSVGADGAVDRAYMALMASEADQALAALPADDSQRNELLQWQVEGLTLQLNDARDHRDWPAAFATLERLAALPPSVVNADTLAETRRALTVQQALQLLEEGDNEAAMQLAGAQVTSADLLPPASARPLFATWQVTATIAPAGVGLVFLIQPVAGREQEAQRALESLVQSWESTDRGEQFTFSLQPAHDQANDAFRLALTWPATVGAASLARVIPPGADWALVRTLLAQLAPDIERHTQLLYEQIRLSQPLDLRSTHEQWTGIAATLEQQASESEAQSPQLSLAATDTNSAEGALVARIKAANLRAAATAWRTLARNSLVAVQLSAGVGAPPVTRIWLATPETPLQTLQLEADVVSLGRLLVLIAAGFAGLFLTAGALWWLL